MIYDLNRNRTYTIVEKMRFANFIEIETNE